MLRKVDPLTSNGRSAAELMMGMGAAPSVPVKAFTSLEALSVSSVSSSVVGVGATTHSTEC